MSSLSIANWLILALSGAVLSGCGGLAGHGPSTSNLRAEEADYKFVPVESIAAIPEAHNHFKSSGAPRGAPTRRYVEDVTLRDQIQILITDASSTSSPYYRTGTAYTYGPVEVPQSGKITVPYIGEISVLQRSLTDISEEINTKVKTVSSSAEATVTRPYRLPKRANVLGEVNQPGAFIIDRKGLTVIDLLAAVGGTRASEHLYIFTLKRNGVDYVYDSASIRRLAFPVEDGDLLSVEKNPKRAFYVTGTINRQGRFDFPNESPTLADALASSSGLNERSSHPKGVFVFRSRGGTTDLAYGVDMKKTNAASIAHRFKLEGGDSIYVSEAPLTQWNRFVNAILPFGQQAVSLGATAASVGN